MSKPLLRAGRARIFDHFDSCTIVGPNNVAHRLEGDSAELARAVLAHLSLPRDREQLAAHLAELSGGALEHPEVLDQLLQLLLDAGAIQESAPAAEPSTKLGARVLLGLTGAIATANSPELIRRLQRRGHSLRVAATKNALRFVTTEALAALTHEPVYTGLFDGPSVAPHIQLAEWAEAMVISPASATTIARLAAGDCSDLVAAIAIATRAPVLLAPSMNPAMLEAPSVQRNLETLRDDGFFILHPQLGEEVAHRPAHRTPIFGGAADSETVADLLEVVLATLRDPEPSSRLL